MLKKSAKMLLASLIAATAITSCETAAVSSSSASSSPVMWLPADTLVNPSVTIVKQGLADESSTIAVAVRELRRYVDNREVSLVKLADSLPAYGNDGYRIISSADGDDTTDDVRIIANTDIGLLYGVYELIARPDFCGDSVAVPAISRRILNHWDNLDGTVERGYAGHSLWDWESLPDTLSPRYEDYARANASIGINGTVLNNVNASPKILTRDYLIKVSRLADIFRPYGIRVYLSVNFASPMVLDSLPTADPLDRRVAKWWADKADEIYSLIPDFGGFLVKANSEGQPGPMDFGRSHADGANMLAKALAPHDGIVMWRAFVYSPADADRAKQAYLEFQPLDGRFDPNVIIQIKNGPVDFQPREPYSPLFGAMPQTAQMPEFQITQEYLGHANHLAYLATIWTEFFDYVDPDTFDAIAGVANIGDDPDFTGNPLAQANWYAFGRLAWNPRLSAYKIAVDWVNRILIDPAHTPAPIIEALVGMFVESREAVVDYMMPLGLHHLFAFGHHYGPEPWCDVDGARPDWLPKYYHRADSLGLGFDRSPSGSNAVAQYPEPLRSRFASLETCPEQFLLWFHHVDWRHTMKSGKTLWDELCLTYQRGVDRVAAFNQTWADSRPYIDPALHADITRRLATQLADARWWRDACLLYFAEYSRLPLPQGVEAPAKTLDEYKAIRLPINNYVSPSAALLDSVR